MKVLSLFDGMACGMLAMKGAEIQVDRYVAYEIDKYAVQTSSHNFPMIEHGGDVFEADFYQYKGFDFLVGGSPCTYWSIAQKNNRETEASGMGWMLFSQYLRALRQAQPMFFIYENNKSMSNAIREEITQAFGFEPICINSAIVSAQNRQRLYWVGKRNFDGTYSRVDVQQPEDRGILLKDILESGRIFYETTEGKSFAIPSSYYKAGESPFSSFGNETRRQRVAEPVGFALNDDINQNIDELMELCSDNSKIVSTCKDIKKLLGIGSYELDPQSVMQYGCSRSTRIGRILAGDKNKKP